MPLFSSLVVQNDSDLLSQQFKEAKVRIAYILDDQQWLSYALQPGEDRVRVMSNVVLENRYKVADEDRFLYSIDYEVLDDKENVIKSGLFYHRGAQKVYRDEVSAQEYVSTSLYPAEANPADSRIHLINLRGLKAATTVRFRRTAIQFPIKQIVLRAYQKKNISDRKLDYAWQRMGDERREQLAKVSVYDSSIINENEQRQLLKNQWAPLGPLGVEGEDYVIQKLYVVREVENDVIVNMPAVPSTGLVIYPQRYGMLILPEETSRLKFSWSMFDNQAVKSATDQVTIEWWGRPATRYKKWTTALSAGEFLQNMDNGIVRISSQQPIVIRVWRMDNNQLSEITPKPAYLRLYSPAGSALVYRVNHIRGYKTPIRFDVRSIDDQPLSPVSYRLLDKHDRLIKSGTLSIKQDYSAYDAVVTEPDRWVTESRSIYFNLPRRVQKVSFSAASGMWISAYTRPKNLPYIQRDPLSAEQRKKSIPVWFSVRPEKWKEYMSEGRSQLITIQRRPPQIDQQLLAGMYKWEQFYPDMSWKGRSLFTQLEDAQPFREEARSSRFVKLAYEETTELNFMAKAGMQTLRPTLIYTQLKKQPLQIRIWKDGQLYFEKQVFSKNGEIQLPYLSSGLHKLRVAASLTGESEAGEPTINDSTDFYINNINSEKMNDSSVSLLRRLAINIPDNKLSFTVLKEKQNELLALRIYSHHPMRKELELKVKIGGLDKRKTGPFDDWTLIYRNYELGLPQNEVNNIRQMSPIILNTDHSVDNERLFFIPLGSDMKNNVSYKIDIDLVNGSDAYMVLTRTIPGLYPGRQLYPDIEIESIDE